MSISSDFTGFSGRGGGGGQEKSNLKENESVGDNFTVEKKTKEVMMLASKASSGNEKPIQELPQRIPKRSDPEYLSRIQGEYDRFWVERKERNQISRAQNQIQDSDYLSRRICLRLKSKILSRLPVELIPDILSLLPIENLLQLRCCNKGFRDDLIDDPYFRKLYNDRVIHHSSATDHTGVSFFTLIQLNEEYDSEFHFAEYDDSSIEYKVTQRVTYPPLLDCPGSDGSRCIIVGSCNGLICRADFSRIRFDPIYIFNPVTREELKLPPHRIREKSLLKSVANGFGYHPVTKEYKVVRIYYTYQEKMTMTVNEVEVYTLGTGVWRSIGVPSLFNTITFQFWTLISGVLVNGALHWIDRRGNVTSFDLETEDFHLIPSPSSFQPVDDNIWYNICALTDRLCVFYHIVGVGTRVDIWALNKDQSWTKEYNIAVLSSNDDSLDGDYIYPITLTKSGKLLLLYNDKILVSYDPKNGERKIHGEYKAGYYDEVVVHVKSFVSLKALGEKNAKITRIRN